jgi:hypothetical protein
VKLNYANAISLKNTAYDQDTVKYAVALYGISVDTDEDGNTIGLTFGPASGAPGDSILNTYGNYKDAYVSHDPWGTTAKGNAHRCIHDDDWATIIEWGKKDPQVYEQCLYMGTRWKTDGDGNGDGAGVLAKSVGVSYLQWNVQAQVTGEIGLIDSNNGGWPASRIRAVLNGADKYTADGTHTTAEGSIVAGTDVASMTADNSFLALFPKELRDVIVAKKVKSDTVREDAINYNKITYDRLWLLSGSEMMESSDDYDSNGFGTAYTNDSYRILRQHEGVGDTRSTAAYTRQHDMGISVSSTGSTSYTTQKALFNENGTGSWSWTRTVYEQDDSQVYCSYATSGFRPYNPSNGVGIGISPCFCIN